MVVFTLQPHLQCLTEQLIQPWLLLLLLTGDIMVSSVCFFSRILYIFYFYFFTLNLIIFTTKIFAWWRHVLLFQREILQTEILFGNNLKFKIKPIHTWSDKYYFFYWQILFIVKDTWDFQHLQKTWKDIRSIFFSFDEKKFKFCWIYQNLKEIINSSCFFYSIIWNFWWFCQLF